MSLGARYLDELFAQRLVTDLPAVRRDDLKHQLFKRASCRHNLFAMGAMRLRMYSRSRAKVVSEAPTSPKKPWAVMSVRDWSRWSIYRTVQSCSRLLVPELHPTVARPKSHASEHHNNVVIPLHRRV